MPRTYEHIKDCWNAIREYDEQGKTYDELLELTQEFPRWSGNWDIEPNEYNNCRVINSYYEEEYQNWDQDIEDTDIPWPLEREED